MSIFIDQAERDAFEAAVPSATVTGSAINRPTPDQIDELAKRYQDAKLDKVTATEAFEEIEDEAIRMVTQFGIVPPNAEKSRRLTGTPGTVLTVTKADTLFIDDERVITLRDALKSAGRFYLFARLFTVRSKYEMVEDAEKAIIGEKLSKRLTEKLLNLYSRCIKPKPKAPSLKVAIPDPAKPARKSRAKKDGGAQ